MSINPRQHVRLIAAWRAELAAIRVESSPTSQVLMEMWLILVQWCTNSFSSTPCDSNKCRSTLLPNSDNIPNFYTAKRKLKRWHYILSLRIESQIERRKRRGGADSQEILIELIKLTHQRIGYALCHDSLWGISMDPYLPFGPSPSFLIIISWKKKTDNKRKITIIRKKKILQQRIIYLGVFVFRMVTLFTGTSVSGWIVTKPFTYSSGQWSSRSSSGLNGARSTLA